MENYQRFFEKYSALYRPVINKTNAYLAQFNLYHSQWLILSLLLHSDPKTIGEIAKHQNVEKPTVTRIVQRLMNLGYVQSSQGKDKREKKVKLTSLGEKICADVHLAIKQFQKDALRGTDDGEIEKVIQILVDVRENIIS